MLNGELVGRRVLESFDVVDVRLVGGLSRVPNRLGVVVD